MDIRRFFAGDIAVMKKKHPCSSFEFKILRAGADVKVECLGCKRELTFERDAFEKMIKKVLSSTDTDRRGD